MCSLNGADPARCTSPYEVDGLLPGEHVFEVYATHPTFLDIHGEPVEPHYEPVVVTYEWIVVDTTPPDTAITYKPRATTGSPNAYFGVVSNEGAARIECSLDFEGFGNCEEGAVYEDLLPGEHVLHARAVDLSENVDPTPAEYRWSVVRGPANTPVGNNVELSLPIDGGAGDAKLSFFEVSMAGATGLDELDGGPPIALPGYGGARFFDLYTSAEYGEPVSLCVPYNVALYDEGARPPARVRRQRVGRHHAEERLPRRQGLRRARGLRPHRARARLRGGAARDDLRRAGLPLRGRHGDLHLRLGHPRHDDAVLARRPAVHAVHVADALHAPRDRRAQVRGPGVQPDRRLHPDAAHALRVGGRARARHDAARHADPQGPAERLGERDRAARVHRCRRPDDRPRARVRVPARRHPHRRLRLDPGFAGRAGRALRARARRGRVRPAHGAGARDRRDGQRRPDARDAHVDLRRHQLTRHVDRASGPRRRPKARSPCSSSSARTSTATCCSTSSARSTAKTSSRASRRTWSRGSSSGRTSSRCAR